MAELINPGMDRYQIREATRLALAWDSDLDVVMDLAVPIVNVVLLQDQDTADLILGHAVHDGVRPIHLITAAMEVARATSS